MPALPEFPNIKALIRRIEIHGNADIKHEANTGGHITVSREVEIQLEGIANSNKPRLCGIERVCGAKSGIYRNGKCIGNNDFFEQSPGESEQARGKGFASKVTVFRIGKLRNDFTVKNNRTGNQLREKSHKQGIIQKVIFGDSVCIAVNDVGKLLKGKERNTKGQNPVVKRQMQREGVVQVFGKEIVVSKQKKNAKIACDADQKQSETQCFFVAVQHLL